MIHVDDQVARGERRQFGQEGIGAFLALLAADQAVAQQVLLGYEFKAGVGKAIVQRQHHRCRYALCGQAQRILPGFGLNRGRFDRLAQDRGDPRPAAGGVAGDQRLAALRRLASQIARCYLVNIVAPGAFRSEIPA